MKTVLLITITFSVTDAYNMVSKNEPDKIQVASLIRDIAKEKLGLDGMVKYEEYHHAGGSHKLYKYSVGEHTVVAEVKRLPIYEFDKSKAQPW